MVRFCNLIFKTNIPCTEEKKRSGIGIHKRRKPVPLSGRASLDASVVDDRQQQKTRSSKAGKRVIDKQADRCRSRVDYEEYMIPQSPADRRGEQQYDLEMSTIVANLTMVLLFVNCKSRIICCEVFISLRQKITLLLFRDSSHPFMCPEGSQPGLRHGQSSVAGMSDRCKPENEPQRIQLACPSPDDRSLALVSEE